MAFTRLSSLAVVLLSIEIFTSQTVLSTSRKSNKLTKVGENWEDALRKLGKEYTNHNQDDRRVKRWTQPSAEEIQLVLDLHNNKRRLEGAANMEFMSWNNVLRDMAGAWGDLCMWEHGQPTGFNPPYNSVGQNLYIVNNANLLHSQVITDGMTGFYDAEKPFYNFDTTECTPGEQCGHYTQVVWADSVLVGCAISFCATVKNLPDTFSNSLYLVCNYGPGGNIYVQNEDGTTRQLDPYIKGPACTKCASGNFWCDNGLCRSKDSCDSSGANCECQASCQNCGSLDSNSCSCTCTKGFTGSDCSAVCEDTHHYCGANPGWPEFWCDNPNTTYVKPNCPKLCGVCEPLAAGESPGTCGPVTTTTTLLPTTTTTTSTTTSTQPTTTQPTTTTTTRPTSTTQPTTTTTTQSTSTTQPTTTTMTQPTSTTQPTTTTTSESTTTTTKATTTTTRQPTTITQVDCSGYCKNGATTSVVGNQCRCTCTANWQGDMCDESREEAQIGIRMTLYARLDTWNMLWDTRIQPILVNAVNLWCNLNVQSCCAGAAVQMTTRFYNFLTKNEIVLGEGFPKEEMYQANRWQTVALFYAFGSPNNDLCQNTVSNGGTRKKRTIPDMTLSQDVLETIVMTIAQNLTVMLESEYNVTIGGIEKGSVGQTTVTITTTAQNPLDKKGPFGLELWVWVLIGIGAGVLILIVLTVACCCCCGCGKKSTSKADKYRSAENGHNNHAYNPEFVRY